MAVCRKHGRPYAHGRPYDYG